MNADQQKAAIVRYYDAIWSRGDLSLLDELFAPNYVNVDPATPGRRLEGRAAFAELVRAFRAGLPDLRMRIERQVAEGDTVVSYWVAEGTHRGPLFGAPATGRRVSAEGFTMSRFAGDRIVEDVAVWDALGLVRQLGGASS